MKKLIIESGKRLVSEKMVTRSWGNLSARADEKTMIITPSGSNYMKLTEDDLVEVDLETGNYDPEKIPSSELEMHSKIYAYIKEANFVIHTHQKYATAVSVLGKKGTIFEDDITTYQIAGSTDLADEVLNRLKATGKNYVIIANHGALAWGESCEETFRSLQDLEDTCREFIEGLQLEDVTDDEIPAYLEDFAMYAGGTMEIRDGQLVMAQYHRRDSGVFEELAQKNLFVHQVAKHFGAGSLDDYVITLMENKFKNQYSKLY